MAKRAPNFTASELSLLLDLVDKYKSVIENKKTDGKTVQQKSVAWVKLATEFNAQSAVHTRDADQLRRCFENQKKKSRKEIARHRYAVFATGGGPPPSQLSSTAIQVASIVPGNLQPLQNTYDSDASRILDAISSGSSETGIPATDVPNTTCLSSEVPASSRRRPLPPRRPSMQPAQKSALWYKKLAQSKILLNQKKLEVAKVKEQIAKEKLAHLQMDAHYKAMLLESAQLDVELKRRQLANMDSHFHNM
ncbi:myb/SANT-like DNA-binding domain-containing protein 3 [Ornithodoros turicata]|uniref:myb/SANT-like DNA-binding domain-containing protein 3 n=1 Tax=Ornithodoros turicata TaxID=34597 RepID=UPI00313A3A1F